MPGEEKTSKVADKAKKEEAKALKEALEPKKINHDALAEDLKNQKQANAQKEKEEAEYAAEK